MWIWFGTTLHVHYLDLVGNCRLKQYLEIFLSPLLKNRLVFNGVGFYVFVAANAFMGETLFCHYSGSLLTERLQKLCLSSCSHPVRPCNSVHSEVINWCGAQSVLVWFKKQELPKILHILFTHDLYIQH